VDVGLDAFVEGLPVEDAGKKLFHGGCPVGPDDAFSRLGEQSRKSTIDLKMNADSFRIYF
jgi:hypothetical protein